MVRLRLPPFHPRRRQSDAGDTASARELSQLAARVAGETFRLTRAGPIALLSAMINVMRLAMPAKDETYPPWQGMQYLHDMFSGLLRDYRAVRAPN
jgi:hypothetical protein